MTQNKLLTFSVIFSVLVSCVYAVDWNQPYDKPVSWTFLKDYPVSCPAGTFATQLEDSVTCTAPTAADVDPGTFPTGNYVFQNNLTVNSGTLFVDSTGNNVGIGTASPDSKLQINGLIHQGTGSIDLTADNNFNENIIIDKTTPTWKFRDGTTDGAITMSSSGDISFTTETVSNALTLVVGGNVGIRTSTPSYPLDVNGSARVYGSTLTFWNSSFTSGDGNNIYWNSGGAGGSLLLRPNGTSSAVSQVVLGSSGLHRFADSAGNYQFYINNGLVGINTSPAFSLDIAGNKIRISGIEPQLVLSDTDGGAARPNIYFSGNGLFYFAGDDTAYTGEETRFAYYSKFSATRKNDAVFQIFGNASNSWGNYLSFTHTGDGGYGNIGTDVGDIILSPATGRIGIGTSSPSTTLQTTGNASFATTSGKVGIGTSTPTNAILDVVGSAYISDQMRVAGNLRATTWISNSATTGLVFKNYGGTEMARMSDSGYFGFNTTSPQANVHVNGTARFERNITMISPDGTSYNCGVANGGTFSCS